VAEEDVGAGLQVVALADPAALDLGSDGVTVLGPNEGDVS
jgi:hypothetical protein